LHAPGSVTAEKLANDLCAALLFLIQVNFGGFHAKDPKIRGFARYSNFGQNRTTQIIAKRIMRRKMTEIFFGHNSALYPRGVSSRLQSDYRGKFHAGVL
jgi:hypothetical protein